MKYLRLYNYESEHEADAPHWVENKYSTCYMREEERPNRNYVVDYHRNRPLTKTVQELINEGYAEIKTDYAESSPTHAESNWQVVQIFQNCPVMLENITDFDTWLTSATTFVWREPLPNGWSAEELAAKYNNAELARYPMEEMFPGVDMGSVSSLTLSFAAKGFHINDSSILTHRYKTGLTYLPTPENVTITIRRGSDYSSVFQTSLSNFRTTKHITLNAGQGWVCHDIVGMFEYDYELTGITFGGRIYGWLSNVDDGLQSWGAVFDSCSKLIEVPLLNGDLARNHNYNYIYPHRKKSDWNRGMASLNRTFKDCTALESIKPTINMLAINSFDSDAFNCPNLTDIRILNLNNINFDFTSPDYFIPKMDVESIQYLLSNVSAQKATEQGLLLYYTDDTMTETTTTATDYPVPNNNTITLNDLHRNEIAQSYIDAAAAKGWTVVWNHVDL